MDELYGHLTYLYGAERAHRLRQQLEEIIARFQLKMPHLAGASLARVDERDAILITYGDMIQSQDEPPLRTLAAFLDAHVRGLVNGVHLLPIYPYSSDDGFSVIDYWAVDPALGSWEDVVRIGRDFRLMLDAVINHISAKSAWFQGFLQGDGRYQDHFIVVDPATDLSSVFRPRALPLLTAVHTNAGPRHVWTTFSADQIDLNYAHPDVLLAIIDLLLFYVEKGARLIRLDAIGFLWKQIGTSCLHRPQTHRIIQLMRSVLDRVAPDVVLISETNVPHEENISYFGDGRNEAQMVYNFSLPPLTLHAFHTASAETLSRWAASLTLPSNQATFFNFLASHDGIGVTPARGILSAADITAMANRVQQLGGHVSFRSHPDGGQSAYELNINFLDALSDPNAPHEPVTRVARRFLAAQAIMLALRGVPGIYFHSLFGSRGWPDGVRRSGRFRAINRQKLGRDFLEQEIADPGSLRHAVFNGYANLLRQRAGHPAFNPNGPQQVIFGHQAVLALLRRSPDGESAVLCLHNVSGQPQPLRFDLRPLDLAGAAFTDLLTNARYQAQENDLAVTMAPYAVLWLANDNRRRS